MKFESLFLLIISLATVSSLVDIHPAYAQNRRCTNPCTCGDPSYCPDSNSRGIVSGGTTRPLPPGLRQQVNDLISKGNFTEAEQVLVQFLGQAERTQDLSGQAAAHQVLGDVYVRMNKPNLASSHLTSAGALYQRLGNFQGSSEVQRQIQQIQPRQIQLQQR